MINTIERYFRLSASGTTVRTELLGGLTTFLTMAYILFVNPNVLGETGMDRGALITGTTTMRVCLSTVLPG